MHTTLLLFIPNKTFLLLSYVESNSAMVITDFVSSLPWGRLPVDRVCCRWPFFFLSFPSLTQLFHHSQKE